MIVVGLELPVRLPPDDLQPDAIFCRLFILSQLGLGEHHLVSLTQYPRDAVASDACEPH